MWSYQGEGAEDFVAQTGVTFPIGRAMGPGAILLKRIGDPAISWFPYEVLVDREGRVAHYTSEYDATVLSELIEAALDAPSPSPPVTP